MKGTSPKVTKTFLESSEEDICNVSQKKKEIKKEKIDHSNMSLQELISALKDKISIYESEIQSLIDEKLRMQIEINNLQLINKRNKDPNNKVLVAETQITENPLIELNKQMTNESTGLKKELNVLSQSISKQKELINRAYVPVLFCGIVLTCWQMVHTYYWNENINYIREKLDNCGTHIYVPAADEDLSSFFNEDLRRYIWANGYPALSILSNKKYKTKTFLFPPEETKSPADETYLSHIWVSKERGIISIPIGTTLSIRNKFWDLSDCVDEIENYIESTGVETTKPENPDDIIYP